MTGCDNHGFDYPYMKKYLTLLEDGMSSGEPELTKAHARLQAQISSRATPRFELFMGCLGNRIAVCNKAVEENGDYKMVAHISIEGNVIWCIAPGDAPAKDVIKIRHVADMNVIDMKSGYLRSVKWSGMHENSKKWQQVN